MNHFDPSKPPLASDAGVDSRPDVPRDVFEALDELMVVIEGLCPSYPERPPFSDTDEFRL